MSQKKPSKPWGTRRFCQRLHAVSPRSGYSNGGPSGPSFQPPGQAGHGVRAYAASGKWRLHSALPKGLASSRNYCCVLWRLSIALNAFAVGPPSALAMAHSGPLPLQWQAGGPLPAFSVDLGTGLRILGKKRRRPAVQQPRAAGTITPAGAYPRA